MYLRETAGVTLEEFRNTVDERWEAAQVATSDVRIDLTSDNAVIEIGGKYELPANQRGVQALASYVGVPSSFFDRITVEEREWILRQRLLRHGAPVNVLFNDEGVLGAYKPGQTPIDPGRIVGVAAKVTVPTAEVISFVNNPDEFSFDLAVPLDYERAVGGDPDRILTDKDRRVGDITRGGLTFGYNRKQNLAPFVQPWMYRLWCTNGCSNRDSGLRIDMRGLNTVDEVLGELENAAQRAFGRVEQDIADYYALREQTVPNPERAMRQAAREHGLSDRVTMQLIDRIPAALQEENIGDGEVTMFDIANIITNQANSPALRSKPAAQRELQAVGGDIATHHRQRCNSCAQAI